MANEDHDPRDDLDLAPPREDFGAMMTSRQEIIPAGIEHALSPRQVGDLFGTLTTAQPVIKDRDIPKLMNTLKALATSFGDGYVYSWRQKDKNSKEPDNKTQIEGPTIQLANDLAREYGNCCLDIREIESATHWVFYGRFIDLQTGYTLTRAFRQRKNAAAGKYEDDRKLDISYQIGQSKCLRNVVINALRNYSEFMIEEAKGALLEKIEKKPAFYLRAIEGGLEKWGVSLKSAEAMVGRAKAEWKERDIAKLFSALKAIAEGLTDAQEVFPKDGPQIKESEATENNAKTAKQDPSAGDGDGSAAASATAEAEGAEVTGKSPSAPKAEEKKAESKATPKEEKPKTETAVKKPAARPKALFDQE